MKMKKIVLLFSMIAVLFSLTACSSGQDEINFSYTDTDIIGSSVMLAYNLQSADDATKAYLNAEGEEVYKTALSNFEKAVEECGDFQGYCSKEDGSTIMIDLANLNSETDGEIVAEFLGLIDATIVEEGANVKVTLKTVYDERNVDICFVYEEDPSYAYGGSSVAYKPAEITVIPEYTMGEKMTNAALNTLMGMGTVFIILIFISFIIAQFERISKIGQKADKEEKVAAPVVEAVQTSTSVAAPNLMDDAQLVAVITAAIMEANGTSSNGSDKLIVRSIRKAKR